MLGWPPWRSRTPWSSRRCRGAPTAVMTTNLHPLHHGLGEVPVRRNRTTVTQARRRAARTWPAIVGFAADAALGAACFATAGLTLLVLPIGLALLALPSARGQQPTDANQQAARLNVSRPGRQWPPPRRRQRPGEANHRPKHDPMSASHPHTQVSAPARHHQAPSIAQDPTHHRPQPLPYG